MCPLDGPLAVKVIFLFPRTSNQLWKTKPMPRAWKPKKPDIDNLQKSLFDALTKLAWRDDNQICSLIAETQTASGEESPCVMVAIRRLET
jgi:Holliday junction resolvase RusA-like endonuclease